MNTITPFLWFDHEAEEAVNFYLSVFRNSKILGLTRYGEAERDIAGKPPGTVMTISFQLDGQEFTALNGGPLFRFTPAVSFVVSCETQGEVDEYWQKLCDGGEPGQCGWLTDRYGVSWQVVPTVLPRLLQDPDAAKRERVMKALLRMTKLDLDRLQNA